MTEVSKERGRDTELIGFLEGRILPPSREEGHFMNGEDDKEMQVSSE